MDKLPLIIAWSILGVGLLAAAVFILIKTTANKRREHVQSTSKKISDIELLNGSYSFYSFNPISFSCECNSKYEYDRTDLREFLKRCMEEDLDHFRTLLQKTKENDSLYSFYKFEYNDIINTTSPEEQRLYDKYRYYESMEFSFCEDLKCRPQCSLAIRVQKEYTSPKGKNHYHMVYDFNHNEIKTCFEEILQQRERESDRQYQQQEERAKMSNRLRYEILKRDGFRCVLCGKSQTDGVKLEVDHIKPVSKGGKTEESNLRTLCENCNRGKGAIYDENGLN